MQILHARRLAIVGCILLLFIQTGCATSISDLTPSSGVYGSEVTIKGGHLNNPKKVDFNGTPVPPADILSTTGTEVKVRVPSGATTGPVHVTAAKGTGTSPYPFTVVSKAYAEQEPNNSATTANAAGMNNIITGTLKSSGEDWFTVTSGPSGVWGYTLEISAVATNMPTNFKLRVDLSYYSKSSTRAFTTNTGNKNTTWVALRPKTDVHITVSGVGSGTWPQPSSYALHISRIPIKDTNEANDTAGASTSVALISGTGSVANSYLCNVFDPSAVGSTDIGFKDYYSFPAPLDGQKVGVVVVNAGLVGSTNTVYIELLDQSTSTLTHVYGGGAAASLEYKVPVGYGGTGKWYFYVSNPWHSDSVSGNGPAPRALKVPYGLIVTAK